MIEGIDKLLPANEIADFRAALAQFSDRCVRLRVDREFAEIPFPTQPVPWFDGGYWITDPEVRPGGGLPFAASDFYIQDAASLLPLRLLDVQTDDRICDLCASPGGKASAIAERLGPDGYVVANETIRSRIDVLRHNLARTGRANYATCSFDPDLLQLRCSDLFIKVLVDVPCSGQTLVGLGKQDASAFRAQHIEHCARRARRILAAAARMLAPNGMLVLATCTFSIEENEAQVAWLQETFPNAFQPVELDGLAPWKSSIARGCYRLWPHRDRCRGGFAAALRKTGEIPPLPKEHDAGLWRNGRSRRARNDPLGKESQKEFASWLNQLGTWPIGYRIAEKMATVAEPGIRKLLEQKEAEDGFQPALAATVAGRHWEPTHALALVSPRWFVPNSEVHLSDPQAIAFVAGQSLPRGDSAARGPGGEFVAGWVRAKWCGKPIGWLKASGNRWNNHLPAWARLAINASTTDRQPSE
ncbi:MAG: methyltransferase RsmF C-terminal domain-like protein [Planctomycetota bacterium]